MDGRTVGKYRIVSRLGRGGMGTVYRAVDETLERDVAIKILNPDLADAEVLKRFRAEAVTLARLNHPNIATLYELAQDNDDLVMVMEFVRGETFDRLSDRLGPLPFDRAAALCSQVLDALGHAHRVGIVHRDLKPANLMVTESGIVKVMDFGIARMVGAEHLTIDGYMMGTPAYMAPEQVMGNEVDGRADLYSMGVVLYRLLTANLPFKADTAIAMVQKQIKDPPTPLRQFRSNLPAWCQGILDRALAKAPHERFQTAEEFRAALAQALAPAAAMEAMAGIAIAESGTAAPSELDVTVPPNVMFTPVGGVPNAPAEQRDEAPAQQPVAKADPVVPRPAAAARPRKATGLLVTAAVATLVVLTAIIWRLTRHVPPGAASSSSAAETAPVQTDVQAPRPVPLAPPGPAIQQGPKRASSARSGAPRPKPKIEAAPAPPAPALPPIVFPQIRLLVFDAGKSSERPASLRLADGSVQILQGEERLKSAPYSAILAIFHSRSKEPRWVTPSGVVVPVTKVDGRKLAFFKGDPDWLTVRTKNEFISLRTDSSSLTSVIAALESRTGLKVIRAASKD